MRRRIVHEAEDAAARRPREVNIACLHAPERVGRELLGGESSFEGGASWSTAALAPRRVRTLTVQRRIIGRVGYRYMPIGWRRGPDLQAILSVILARVVTEPSP
jgi:hypothetical protein